MNNYSADCHNLSNFTTLSATKVRQKITNENINPKNYCQQTDMKKMKKQYQIKIIQLDNQVKFLKDQLQYKTEVHVRQLENMKAILQSQYTLKIRSIRNNLRDQYTKNKNENVAIKEKNKNLQQQIRIVKQKYERAEKYSKQIQQIYTQKINKLKKQLQESKIQFQSLIQTLKKQNIKNKQQEIRILKADFKKEKQLVQFNLKQQIEKQGKKQEEIYQLKVQIQSLIVQKQQLRIQKDRIISQQLARLQVLRQATILQQMSQKKEARQAKFMEIDYNIQQNFDDLARNNMETMILYRKDLQKQILIERQMKRMSQTQIVSKPQIRKVSNKKNTKRNTSTDISQSTCRRISMPDSPSFGTKMSQY